MAYDKQQVITMALEAIEREDCTRVSEVLLYLPISRATFYLWELDKLDEILQKLDETKIRLKQGMKRRWMKSEIPALEIAAFKLIADEDEADAITTTRTKNEHKVEGLPQAIFVIDGNSTGTGEDTGNEAV